MNTRKYTIIKRSLLITISTLLLSCVSVNSLQYEENVTNGGFSSLTDKQIKIVEAALKSCKMGYPDVLTYKNRQFSNDCSGLIYGIFWEADIDLQSEIMNETGNGVTRLYKVMDKYDLIHKKKLPNPGDLVFWNNTYGEWGKKPLSHIGIIISVDNDGNIEYVHNNTYLGEIRKESMNLYRPHEKRPINNYMRYDSVYKKTSGELFDSFGMAWKL